MSEGLTQSVVLSNPSSNGNNCALIQPTTWKTILEAVQTKGPQKPKLSKISCFPISNYNFSLPLPLCRGRGRVTSKNSNLGMGKLTWTFFACFCCLFSRSLVDCFSFSFAQICYPFFRNFKKIQSYLFSTEFGL